ncbi:unnamed protein product [Mytilus coruscus]|uniref:Uncharacterized protein n=1 Tax=Mytilus coruscus TaxID=42192 RepID=A0A6J8F0L5_MYTCO|nr:unnamed protein product [Mytilus coruscus]
MSEEEILVVEQMDETKLFKEDDSNFSTADVVTLLNSSLNKVLQRQKSEIFLLSRLQIDTLNQRNKILKIADRHGWDTVHENLDDSLADRVEDASKLRTAVFRANHKRTANKPYNRGGDREGFNIRDLFRGFSKEMTTTVSKTTSRISTTTDCASKRPVHCPILSPQRTYLQQYQSAPATISSAPPLS